MTSLTSIRTKRGMSGYELAKKSGVQASTISRIERGDSEPTLSTLKKLAKALDVAVSTLLGGRHG